MYVFYVYKITNLLNGKCYVGKHKSVSLHNTYFGSGTIIKSAIKKYGKENFRKDIIEICNESNVCEREKFWIKTLKSTYPAGYNIEPGGEGGDMLSNHPNRNNIIQKMKNRIPWNKGKTMDDNFKQKCKNSFKMTEERHKNMSNSHKNHVPWNKGKKTSDSVKEKLSKSHLGKTPWNKNIPMSESSKKKLSESLKHHVPWNKNKSTGLHWYTNGIRNVLSKECPLNWHLGRTIKHKIQK